MAPIRILLADDHEIVRAGLAAQLGLLGRFEIVHAWSLASLLAAARAQPPCDLAVVDVHMPGMEGGRQLQALCALRPELPLIILSGAATLPLAAQWAGWPSVRAILHKSGPATELRAAIDLALAGGRADSAWPPAHAVGGAQVPALPPRLLQVARAAASGASNQQVGAALGLSEGTVKQYLKEVFRTLGVSSRTQLAVLLHRQPDQDS